MFNSCRSLLETVIPEYAATFMRSSEFYLKFTEGSIYKQSYKGIFIAGSYKPFSAAPAAADPAAPQANPAVSGGAGSSNAKYTLFSLWD